MSDSPSTRSTPPTARHRRRAHPAARARLIAGGVGAAALVGFSGVIAVAESHSTTSTGTTTTTPAATNTAPAATNSNGGSVSTDWGGGAVSGVPSGGLHTSSRGS